MTDTLTPTIRLTEPTPGGDSGTWATLLNSDMAYIDEAINQSVTVSIADVNVVLVADGTVSDQARYLRYNFTGALTADRTVTLPANVKVGWASNNTTGGHNVILSAGGATISLSDGSWTFFNCDGSNVIRQAVRFGALVGTNTNDNASSGQVGEFISATLAGGAALSLVTQVATNIASVSLTAGDWDVRGEVWITSTAGIAAMIAAISNVTHAFPGDPVVGLSRSQITSGQGSPTILSVGPTRVSLAATTTIFLVGFANFGTGTASGYGKIEARRVR